MYKCYHFCMNWFLRIRQCRWLLIPLIFFLLWKIETFTEVKGILHWALGTWSPSVAIQGSSTQHFLPSLDYSEASVRYIILLVNILYLSLNSKVFRQARWHTSLISALGRQRQIHLSEFQASQRPIGTLSLWKHVTNAFIILFSFYYLSWQL